MSNSEHASLMETLRQISRLLGGNNVTWMMSDGSMVGSLRHWDVVPWDDDFVTILGYYGLIISHAYLKF